MIKEFKARNDGEIDHNQAVLFKLWKKILPKSIGPDESKNSPRSDILDTFQKESPENEANNFILDEININEIPILFVNEENQISQIQPLLDRK